MANNRELSQFASLITIDDSDRSIGINTSVGIGTTNPQATLHVVGDTLVTGVSTFNTDVYVVDQLFVGGIEITGGGSAIGTDITTRNLNVTGISTLGIASASQLNITGVSTISVNSSSDALRITQEGSGNALVVEDETNPDATPFVVTSTGSVGIGTTIPIAKLDIRGGITQAGGEETLLVASSDPINIPSTITQGYSNGTLQVFGGGMASGSRRGGQIDFVAGAATTDPGTLIFRTGTGFGGTSQPERVRIDASGNVGIGTTNPTSLLQVQGDARVSGVVTATTFIGALTGIAASATKLETPRTFEITGDVVASAISFDGTGNVSLAATIQPNSVGLGTDTTGDYVRDITGTSNQITVTSGTGEGSTPTLSVPNQFTAPQDVTVTRDLQVNRDLNVNGNITIGGTSATLFTSELKVYDPDLVLGFRTDTFGNDVSTDNTANHGGIAVASTEGSPLVSLFIAGIETTPATYKKIMWFKSGTFTGLNTDAWLTNYAIGIGSTQVPLGVRLAAGGMQVTDSTLSIPQLNVSGVSTFSTGPVLIGTGSSTGTESQALQVNSGAYIAGDTVNGVGLGIGFTNPAYPVDIRLNASANNLALVRIAPSTQSRAAQIVYTNTGSSNMVTGLLNSSGAGQGISGLTPYAGIVGLSSGTSPLLLLTNGLERVRIFDTGEVGIGTTNPTSKLYVRDSNQNSNVYSSIVYRTSTNFSSGVGHLSSYEAYYTTAGVQTSYASASNAQVSASVAAGSTNDGYVRAGFDSAWRNNNNAQSSTDNGTLDRLFGRGIQYGHFDDNAVSPITNTATGLYLTPYCLTGSIGTLIGLDINSVATAVGATATNVRGINCEIDTTDGTDPYNLYIGGNAKNYIEGSVGIGTTNPTAKLHVNGDVRIRSGTPLSGGEQNLIVTSSNVSNIPATISQGSSVSTLQIFSGGMDSGSRRGGQIDFVAGAATTNPGTLIFRTGISTLGTSQPERVRIDASGNVGIGTTNPTAPLHISGADAANAKIKLEDNDNGFAASEINVANGGRDLRIAAPQDIYFEDLDTNTKTLYIKDGGNVGIGTDDPGAKLNVVDNSSSDALRITQTGSGNALVVEDSTNPDATPFVINASGNVGIGTTNPTSLLRVLGQNNTTPVVIGAGNSATFSFSGDSSSGYTANFNINDTGLTIGHNSAFRDFRLQTNSLPRLTITAGGSVGIGTTNPVTPLHISDGNGAVSSALYTSDYFTISAQNTAPGFNIIAASSSSTGHRGVFKATRARGTLSSPTVPLVNDDTFSLLGAIYDGSTTRATAAVNMEVDGTVGVGTAPQRITFWTGTGTSRLERVRITSSGDVGIGTDNPQQPIHLLASNPAIRLQDTGSNNSYAQVSGNGGKLYLQADDNNVQGSSAIEFHLDGDVKALIDSSGNVGIGTTNPTNKLEVYGDIGVGTSYNHRLAGQNSNAYNIGFNSTSALVWGLQTSGGITTTLTITGWGDSNAYIDNRNNGDIYFRSGSNILSNSTSLVFKNGGTLLIGSATSTGTANQTLQVHSGGAYVSGSVGIGTTNPQAKLHVIGDVLFNNTTAQGSVTSTGSTTSAIGIHSGLSTSTYRSVEYTIQATQGTNYHSTKILALHNGTTAYHSEYGTIYNNTSVATFDVDVSGGNIRLLATGASASSTNYVVNFVATKI